MTVLRIIDANVNRAREAMRVMEEAARFMLDDESLTRALKGLRHDFARAVGRIERLQVDRDVAGDVGTTVSTPAESVRTSALDVVCAAGGRLGEALRSIEEYGKTIDPAFAAEVEAMRYRGYALQQRVEEAMQRRRPAWDLCVILTEAVCARPWREVAVAVTDAAPACIQIREKHLDDAALLARVRAVMELSAGRSAIIVNDRPDIAMVAGADGVHLGQGDLPCADVRRLVGPEMIVGVSTSNIEDAQQARRDGADYCGIGPMFPTTTKRKEVIVGPAYARAFIAWGELPHLAIGGITAENVQALIEAGVRGVAVSSAVCGSDSPGALCRTLACAVSRVST